LQGSLDVIMAKDDVIKKTETVENATAKLKQQQEQEQPLQLSKELREFYKNHDVDPTKISNNPQYRYIRLNPRFHKIETLSKLEKEMRVNGDIENSNKKNTSNVISVPWLEDRWGFYAIPANFPLSISPSFRAGRIYGMDVSSGAGVAVLLTDFHNVSIDDTDHDDYNSNNNSNNNPGDNKIDCRAKELRILDLCCSPGSKLLQIVDFFHPIQSSHYCLHQQRHRQHTHKSVKIVGVDISKHRMDICKSIVQKYLIDSETSGQTDKGKEASQDSLVNVQLYLENGTTFGAIKNKPSSLHSSDRSISTSVTATATSCDEDINTLVFDSGAAIEDMVNRRGKRKRMNKSARGRERKRLRQIQLLERAGSTSKDANEEDNVEQNSNFNMRLFDYVMVDAECSTDGSFRHLKERIKESLYSNRNKNDVRQQHHREDNLRLTDSSKLEELVHLQRKLIASGFRLLKNGGTMSYCTCSLSEDQNEKIVQWLLQTNIDAKLIPIHFPSVQRTKFATEGSLKGTIRFYPNLQQDASSSELLLGDGFFVAKIVKGIK